jgi:hypothetical protein
MHMRIHHSLSGRGAPVHAHIESVATLLILQILAVFESLPKALHDVVLRVCHRHEQPVSNCDRISIAENLDTVKVHGEIIPVSDAL